MRFGLRLSCVLVGVLATSAGRSADLSDTHGVRSAPLKLPGGGKVGFTLLPSEQTHLTFTNTLDPQASAENRVLNNGSGVAAGDFNNDGWVDLFFASLNARNRLFQNLGDWTFADVTQQAGLKFKPLFYRSAVFADLDGDGWLDLLVGTASEGVQCFLNDRRGHFTDVTATAGTTTRFANETLALADIDGNGTLDLYAANNRTEDIRDWPRIPVVFVNKKPTVPPQLRDRLSFESGQLQEFGEPDFLYLNDGRAHFSAVSWTNGAFLDEAGKPLSVPPLDWSLCAAFRDLNNDGAPDLYVCSDYWTPDRFWINDGKGRFRAIETLALRKIPASSMGADFADINRDGHLDIFAVDMLSRSPELRKRQMVAKRPIPPRIGDALSRVQTPQNTLLLNRGDGTFAEIACFAGVEASDWSWSPVFLDVDLDGYDDLLITAGHIRDIQDLDANDKIRTLQDAWRRTPMAATNLQRAFAEAKREHAQLYPPLDMPVVAFRNLGNLHFEEVTSAWGLDVRGVNHGVALADLDNDGDLDVIVNRLGAAAAIFRNETTAARIAVRLRGKAPNTQAIGARIALSGAPVMNQKHEVSSGGAYMSGHDTLRVFAPGRPSSQRSQREEGPFPESERGQSLLTSASANEGLKLRVTWRDGSVTDVTNVTANRLYEIDEATSSRLMPHVARAGGMTNSPPMFEEVSSLLNHTHHEEAFDDFARQPLLPRKLSQNGPGVAWFDVDGDGWDDLIIGSGKGGTPAVFRNHEGKSFVRDTNRLFAVAVTRDQTTVLGWRRARGQSSLLVGTASYEDGDATKACVQVYDLGQNRIESPFPGHDASIGPLALADLEGDGDLDLFVGGQVIPGRYPAPATSLLFRQNDGQWSLDVQNAQALTNVGLVNGAVWSDLDGDGFPELVLACEWNSLRLFHNRAGKLADVTREWGLAEFTGLWLGVTTGDFDGDGQLDLVAGNWGLNSVWRASPQQPLSLFYGDVGGRGTLDIIEAEFDPIRGRLAPRHLRDTVASAMPFLAERFPTHAAWSRTTMADIVRDRQHEMRHPAVSTLASTVFLNRKGRFEVRPLPAEAQFSPAFGLCVADFDGDRDEDIFAAQNFFAFRIEDSRLDAGRGLLLSGDGKGNFDAVPSHLSGIHVYGEQRGAAVADFNNDGRLDVVVTQNGAATGLFRNGTARPGLRVRLAGPPGNPDGIGALLRLKCDNGWGLSREVHAGGGYWSQDSAVAVLATPRPPLAVQVSWPGGKKTEQAITPPAGEITVRYQRSE